MTTFVGRFDSLLVGINVQKNSVEVTMTEHDREILKKLCAKVSEERDHLRFTELVGDLNALLEKALGPPRCHSDDL